MFVLALIANGVVSILNRLLKKIVLDYPVSLSVDLFFSVFILTVSGGSHSAYYLYVLSPLLAGAFFFRVRGAARYREVDLGSVDPFGVGDAADITIAELEFSVGDKMKYVFDFGEWIEHVLTLEAIEPPQPGAEYPREATRNAPKYANCVECQKKGERNSAVFICFSCTKSPNEERLLCEKCAEKYEDHYVEKILY